MSSSTGFRVRWEECDPQGIVFFGEYSTYLTAALAELWRERFGSFRDLVQAIDAEIVTAELHQRFRVPARYDDLVTMTVRVQRIERASIWVGFELTRDGTVLVEGEIRQACVDRRSFAKLAQEPPALRRILGLDAQLDPTSVA